MGWGAKPTGVNRMHLLLAQVRVPQMAEEFSEWRNMSQICSRGKPSTGSCSRSTKEPILVQMLRMVKVGGWGGSKMVQHLRTLTALAEDQDWFLVPT